jgi:hypothetical protein
MKESMPDTHGWIDRGPSRLPRQKNGPVRITRPDGTKETVPAASPGVTIRQGVESPRELSPGTRDRAFVNQVAADEDLRFMERWAANGCCVPEGNYRPGSISYQGPELIGGVPTVSYGTIEDLAAAEWNRDD